MTEALRYLYFAWSAWTLLKEILICVPASPECLVDGGGLKDGTWPPHGACQKQLNSRLMPCSTFRETVPELWIPTLVPEPLQRQRQALHQRFVFKLRVSTHRRRKEAKVVERKLNVAVQTIAITADLQFLSVRCITKNRYEMLTAVVARAAHPQYYSNAIRRTRDARLCDF